MCKHNVGNRLIIFLSVVGSFFHVLSVVGNVFCRLSLCRLTPFTPSYLFPLRGIGERIEVIECRLKHLWRVREKQNCAREKFITFLLRERMTFSYPVNRLLTVSLFSEIFT